MTERKNLVNSTDGDKRPSQFIILSPCLCGSSVYTYARLVIVRDDWVDYQVQIVEYLIPAINQVST